MPYSTNNLFYNTVLNESCEILSGIGPALAEKLTRCGIKTISDLLFHLPYRYQDRTHITPIRDLRANEYCVIAGKVCKAEVTYGKRKFLDCYVEDKTGVLKLRFFHFNNQQLESLKKSNWIRVFGEVRSFLSQPEMIHPEYKLLDNEWDIVVEENLTPIYSSTEGLTQTRIRQLIQSALQACASLLPVMEWMTEAQRQEYNFPTLAEAIHCVHTPPLDISLSALETGQHPAKQRLIFEELIAQNLSIHFAKHHRHQLLAPALKVENNLKERFLNQLPFTLTHAQQRVGAEIAEDLTKTKPMQRLIQGDVGCGKTSVCALAALQAIANGYQVALMAPTELLSEQLYNRLEDWFSPLGIKCSKLSGKMKDRERREILKQLLSQECQLLIGTHALFQEQVVFSKLGLIIIDEQHRFGVEQRLSLQQKGQKENWTPHQLLMTATPIPRTLAMTQFAHLDISIIDELPAGRIPVNTAVINQDKRETIIARLQEVIAEGVQAYWVCTLIEESEKLQCIAATLTAETLQAQLPNVRIGLVHGRMKSSEKEGIMQAFKNKELDLLVATTVIEVGVDVPNASLMIIENAERLGLSQLHQLRGRVGRGNKQSHCLLLYQTPLSFLASERLRIMRSTTDGFLIAEKDLELRGAGEILGKKQTGYKQFKIVDLQRDKLLIPKALQFSKWLFSNHYALAHQIATRWLGEFEQFLQS